MSRSGIKGLEPQRLLTIERSSGNHFWPLQVLPQFQIDKRHFPHSGKRSNARPAPRHKQLRQG